MTGEGTISKVTNSGVATGWFRLELALGFAFVASWKNDWAISSPITTAVAAAPPIMAAQRNTRRGRTVVTSKLIVLTAHSMFKNDAYRPRAKKK